MEFFYKRKWIWKRRSRKRGKMRRIKETENYRHKLSSILILSRDIWRWMEIPISSPFFCSRFPTYFLCSKKKWKRKMERGRRKFKSKGSEKDETWNRFSKGGVCVKSVINEIWHGNIVPQEDSRINSKEMKELLGFMARHHETLEKSFSNEQKEIFERFHDCWNEYMSLAEAAVFSYAFKLGAQIMLEILNSKEGE